jgi:spore maturation protein CgeB
VTLAKLKSKDCDYLSPDLISQYRIYLSFTGGPTLRQLENEYRSPMARALYCSVDLNLYSPARREKRWAVGYLGTYSDDRQPALKELLLEAAQAVPKEHFVVAGPQYPETIVWPKNVRRITHLEPALHRTFYNEQKFTLNITRSDMKRAGYSPSVRLFEAAACGTPIISDYWDGIETFFEPDKEILIARSTDDTLRFLRDISPAERARIGERARKRVMDEHTAAHRAAALQSYVMELLPKPPKSPPKESPQPRQPKIVISRKAFYESVQ